MRIGAPAATSPKHDRALTPVGMATLLPHAAQRMRHLEEVLLTCLSRWGYQEIIPPTFEYLDVLSAGLEPEMIEKCYKFADRTTGRILLLRPDVTAQIARIVAMGMVGPGLPLRLCYRAAVFRYEGEHAGREREIFQVGAELIGVDDVATDAEIIALTVDCLRQFGVPTFKISLGHVGFFKGLLSKSGLSVEGQKRAEQAAAHKDLPRLEEILLQERVSRTRARAILEAPGLYGREETLERGRALAGRHRDLRTALERLERIYRLLSGCGLRDHLLLDLGEFRGFDYYDGVVFDVFAEGIGCELGGGGRYNHLIGRFGRDLPSTGFAFDLDRLFRAMDGLKDGLPCHRPDIMIVAPTSHGDLMFRVAKALRTDGYRVLQAVLHGHDQRAIQRALEQGQAQEVPTVVILGLPGTGAEEALVITGCTHAGRSGSRGAVRTKVKIKDIPSLIKKKKDQATSDFKG